ncbi:MAG: hypothetical protein RLZ93_1429, partial [Bacteroidota bacterium]
AHGVPEGDEPYAICCDFGQYKTVFVCVVHIYLSVKLSVPIKWPSQKMRTL